MNKKKQVTAKLRSKNVSPTNNTENNSYAKKYNKRLFQSRQSNNQEKENYSEHLTITQNSSPTNQCSTFIQQQQKIVQQQKREISILKLGCSKCISNKNTDLDLRQKIIMQNKQILQLMSKETSLQDYVAIQKSNNQLQKENEELKQSQEILKMNQQQILQENLLLKNLLFEQNNNSSQIFNLSQSQGIVSSIVQFNSQLYSSSHTQSIIERGYQQIK